MASYTNPILHATGDDLAVTDYNGVANNTTFLYQAPYCSYYNRSSTSVTTTTFTQVSLGGTTASGYGFSVSSNNAIVPLTGTYHVDFSVGIAELRNDVTVIISALYQNGTSVANGSTAAFNNVYYSSSAGSTTIKCTAGDTLGLWVTQTSGGTFGTVNDALQTYLAAFFVGSQ